MSQSQPNVKYFCFLSPYYLREQNLEQCYQPAQEMTIRPATSLASLPIPQPRANPGRFTVTHNFGLSIFSAGDVSALERLFSGL